MTRSTRHITPCHQLAALVFAALRLGLENRQETPKQVLIPEQIPMEMLDNGLGGAESLSRTQRPLSNNRLLGGSQGA